MPWATEGNQGIDGGSPKKLLIFNALFTCGAANTVICAVSARLIDYLYYIHGRAFIKAPTLGLIIYTPPKSSYMIFHKSCSNFSSIIRDTEIAISLPALLGTSFTPNLYTL